MSKLSMYSLLAMWIAYGIGMVTKDYEFSQAIALAIIAIMVEDRKNG